jgi:hypothetical protein
LVVDEVASVPEVDGDVVVPVPVPVVVALSPVVESPVVVAVVVDEVMDVEDVVASVLVVEAPEVVSSTSVVDEVGDPLPWASVAQVDPSVPVLVLPLVDGPVTAVVMLMSPLEHALAERAATRRTRRLKRFTGPPPPRRRTRP